VRSSGNLTFALVALGLLVVILVFTARPGVVLPVDAGNVASSIGDSPQVRTRCTGAGDGFRCFVPGRDIDVGSYVGVDVGWDGCWHATQLQGVRGVEPAADSGCVDLWDY
jgi:hypothetical protein